MIEFDKLSEMVFQHRKDNYGDYPRLITVHPSMMIRLIDQARAKFTNNIVHNGRVEFMGVRVIRSVDVQQDEILIT